MMELLKEALSAVQGIQSFIGLVAFSLFLILFATFIIYRRTKPASKSSTPGLLKHLFWGVLAFASLLVILYFLLLVFERSGFIKQKSPTIEIFNGYTRLGDNIFSRIGGRSLPHIDDPNEQISDDIIYYDKDSKLFQTKFGIPYSVQFLAAYYGPIFSRTNLSSWRHVSVLDDENAYTSAYKGSAVKIDSKTVLVWLNDATTNGEGHFYSKRAAVARTRTLNIFKELKVNGYSPEGLHLKGATFSLFGLHGSRRPDQPDNVHLIVNQKIYPISLKSLDARNEEFISVFIDSSSLLVAPTATNMFAIIVLPFSEKYPIPPPNFENREGPAHFRDIEFGKCWLELHFE